MTQLQSTASRRAHRVRRAWIVAVAAVSLAILLGATPAGAIVWTKTTVVNAPGVTLQDADFDGHNAAIVWRQPGNVTKVRTSTNDGSSFHAVRTIAHPTRHAQVDICGNKVYVAYSRDYSDAGHPNFWLIDVTIYSTAGVEQLFTMVWPDATETERYPDVACAGNYLVVTWEQKVGSTWHVYMSSAPISDPNFLTIDPIDLGLVGANAGHPVVAGTANRAYVAWPTPAGTIRIHRWAVGGPMVDLGERQLAASGAVPRIDALGTKVTVVWYDCGDIRARVSTNRGGAWGPTKTLFTGACGSEFGGFPLNVALHASRTVVSYHWIQGFANDKMRMISTTNDFTTFTDRLTYPGSDLLLLGFVAPGGVTKLAGAVDEGSVLRYLRQP